MRNRNISGDQFAAVPSTVQAAADLVASETGSARTYPPAPNGNEWMVEETKPHPAYLPDEEYRGMGLQMTQDSFRPNPEELQVAFTDRQSGQDPYTTTAGWGEAYFSDRWNAMDDPDLGRTVARDRFGYGSPESRRAAFHVVR